MAENQQIYDIATDEEAQWLIERRELKPELSAAEEPSFLAQYKQIGERYSDEEASLTERKETNSDYSELKNPNQLKQFKTYDKITAIKETPTVFESRKLLEVKNPSQLGQRELILRDKA